LRQILELTDQFANAWGGKQLDLPDGQINLRIFYIGMSSAQAKAGKDRVRANTDFVRQFKPFRSRVLRRRKILLPFFGIICFCSDRPGSTGGALWPIVTKTRAGMRWTQSAARNLLRGRTTPLRTAKPCGSDPPTLGSRLRKAIPLAMVANKPGHQEERGAVVNTIAQGMPMQRLDL
jgi:hypothetical protein